MVGLNEALNGHPFFLQGISLLDGGTVNICACEEAELFIGEEEGCE